MIMLFILFYDLIEIAADFQMFRWA